VLIRICGKQICEADDGGKGTYEFKTVETGGMYLSDFKKLANDEVCALIR
jgi:hypothetical protein